mgnify:CR=1 FL=1
MAAPPPIEVPLQKDEQGKLRVGSTRVLLELVIHAFQRGETAEEIVDSYPSLKLADVYTVLGYYLNHRAEIDAYVRQADEAATRIQQEAEANYPAQTLALRARLRARREHA